MYWYSTKEVIMNHTIGRKINYLSNQLRSYIDERVKKYGVYSGECRILMYLERNGNSSQEDIRKFLKVDKSATARIIKKLEEKELVVRKKDVEDQRVNRLYLTNKAFDIIEDIQRIYKESSLFLVQDLSEQQNQQLNELLDIVVNHFRGKDK